MQQVVDTLQQQVTLLHEPMLGTVPSLHWAFSDSTGEMAVIEPDVDGLHIYRSTVGVMTNSPGYPWHRTNLLNYVGLRDLDYDEWELEVPVLLRQWNAGTARRLELAVPLCPPCHAQKIWRERSG